MAGAYDKADLIRISVEFRNSANALSDPTTIVCKVKKPDGTLLTYTYSTDATLVKDATGKYHVDVNIDQVGNWFYRWEGSGTLQAAGESKFAVKQTQF